MSGGVDSSVAAALLVQEGYEVVGLTMKLFDRNTTDSPAHSERGCCNLDAFLRANAVCHSLNIPHFTLNMVNDFEHYVISDFIDDYLSGKTPNPCIRCNTYLKWGVLFQKARKIGCDFLATGHYARLERIGSEFHLLRGSDPIKDQAYALWGVLAARLPFTLFPLGALRKVDVRKIAARLGLKSAGTQDSQEICFIPGGRYADFLKKHRPDFFASLQPGELLERSRGGLRRIGQHPGYPLYTVGQRKGLGGGFPQPRYVLQVDPETNQVIIGPKSSLLERKFLAGRLNWLIPIPSEAIPAQVQVRYRSKAFPATLRPEPSAGGDAGNYLTVEFDQPVEAITPGQSAVFFQGDRLIGGGIIQRVFHEDQAQHALQAQA